MDTQKQCYAAVLGGCAGPLTNEDYISKSVLEIAGTRGVRLTGRPWQREPVQSVGVNSLGSHVLCKGHNEALSKVVDPAGKQFFERLVYATKHLINPQDSDSEYIRPENGTLFERWLLKYICGSWAAGDFAKIPGWQGRYQPNLEWVEAVFSRRVLSEPCGLWLGGSDRKEFGFAEPFTMEDTPHFSGDRLLSVVFQINGIELILNLTNDPEHLADIVSADATYHPRSLMIVSRTQTGEGRTHYISFDWGDRPVGNPVLIQRMREW